MIYFVALLAVSLIFSEFINIWILKRVVKRFEKIENQIKEYDRRLDQMEITIVKSVMEENPQIGERIVAQYKAFYQNGMQWKDAIREARRINGLDP